MWPGDRTKRTKSSGKPPSNTQAALCLRHAVLGLVSSEFQRRVAMGGTDTSFAESTTEI